MYISGLVFGAALAVYILSHYDRRVKKVYALVAAIISATTSLADFTSTQIPVSQECGSGVITLQATTQICTTHYSNDVTPLIFFILSIILIILTLVEISLEGVSSAWP
jgi:hypothetical protein